MSEILPAHMIVNLTIKKQICVLTYSASPMQRTKNSFNHRMNQTLNISTLRKTKRKGKKMMFIDKESQIRTNTERGKRKQSQHLEFLRVKYPFPPSSFSLSLSFGICLYNKKGKATTRDASWPSLHRILQISYFN